MDENTRALVAAELTKGILEHADTQNPAEAVELFQDIDTMLAEKQTAERAEKYDQFLETNFGNPTKQPSKLF